MLVFGSSKGSKVPKKAFFGTLLFLGVVFPFPVFAGFWGFAGNVANAIFGGGVMIPVAASKVILAVATWFLNWVLSPDFINWNYTGFGATRGAASQNPLVKIGWKLTRDLTNMLFVIYLAFIGLATALRIEEYKAKKKLPQLLMIALLINFTPVICGTIIDASNIVTNFFLGSTSGLRFLAIRSGSWWNRIHSDYGGKKGLNPLNWINIWVRGILFAVFNIVASVIYFLFAFLFAGRYIAIWVLVIISPFAFFAYLLPPLKNVWKDWWSQFFQWCFIGITGGFFLYLANVMVKHVGEMTSAPTGETFILAVPIVALFQSYLVPYGLCILLLFFGLFKSLSSSAMLSDKAVQAAEWTGAKAKKETWGRIKKSEGVKEYARETAEGEAEGPEEGVREVWRREKGIKKLKAAGTAVGKAHTWMRRRSLVRRGAARMIEATIREREEIEEEGERWHDRYEKSEDRVAAYRSRSQGPITKLEGRQRLVRLAGLGAKDLQKLKEEAPDLLERELRFAKNKHPKVYKEAGLAVPDLLDAGKDWEQEFEEQGMEEAESLGQRFERLGSNMREALVPEGEEDDLVQELKEMKNIQRANLSKERYDQKMDELISVVAMQKSVKKLRPHEVEDQARTVLENDLFQEAVARYGRPGVAKKIAEEGIDLNQTINDELGGEQLVETNQTLARLITHSPNYQALFDVEGLEGKTDYKVLARLKGRPVVKEYYKNLKEIQRTRSGIEEMEGENKIMSGLKEQAEEKGEDDKVTQYENSIAWNQRWIATLEKANKQVKKETSRVRHRFNQEQEKVWNEVQDLLERRGPKGVEGERRPKEEREEEGPEIIVASPRGRPADWDTKQKILEDAKKVLEESGGQEGGAPPTPTPSPPQGPPPSQGPSSSGFDATEYNNKRDKLESLVRGLSPFHLPENVKRAQQLVEEIKDLHDEYPSLKREDPVLERWSPFPELEKTVEKEVKLLEGRES